MCHFVDLIGTQTREFGLLCWIAHVGVALPSRKGESQGDQLNLHASVCDDDSLEISLWEKCRRARESGRQY